MITLECEVCGASDAGKKADIDGADLVVCENCASLGDVTGEVSDGGGKPSKGRKEEDSVAESPIKSEGGKVLVDGYGNLVKKARENGDMSMEELSRELKEKESVIRRTENEGLRPDSDLVEKLERELNLELTEEVEAEEWKAEDKKDDSLTIGDVVEIK